ncbi:MAG: sulfatase-like hydrolase/transferase [Planctomycetota bacterium]
MIAALLACVLVLPVVSSSNEPPNLVVIVADDLGYADVGFNGCEDIPTPNIDRIAAEGVRFSSGYVTSAICGPSRAGLITGRYQHRFGSSLNPTIDPTVHNGVPRDELTIAEMLRPAGYTSMAVGKWHLGTFPGLHPRDRGFDEFYGFLTGGHDYFPENLTLEDLSEVRRQWGWYRTKLLHNGKRVSTDEYLTDELSNAVVDFIHREHGGAFFVYLAYNAPHTPMQATEEYLARFPELEGRRKVYAAMVSAMDDGIGRVLDALDQTDVADNTLVVFLSDNGGARNNASSNEPLRGYKRELFEGGLRVPFAMRWPDRFPSVAVYSDPVISLDIAGTIVAAAGSAVATNPEKPLDGVDLMPYVNGLAAGSPHDALYWFAPPHDEVAIRVGDLKAIEFGGDEPERFLFDLSTDVSEESSRFDERPDGAAELIDRVRRWAESMPPPAYSALGTWDPSKQ